MQGITSEAATVDYLHLLTTQLQHQDPIDPVDQEGMISELAQFSMLEGVEGLNGSFEQMLQLQKATQGMNMVGKNVQYTDQVTGEVITGEATDMFTAGDTVNVLVGGKTVNVLNVTGVSDK
ncbi:MAG: flagellar hook capping FlgD N-terminal domain-containing protein [Pirellulaceae bacterium]